MKESLKQWAREGELRKNHGKKSNQPQFIVLNCNEYEGHLISAQNSMSKQQQKKNIILHLINIIINCICNGKENAHQCPLSFNSQLSLFALAVGISVRLMTFTYNQHQNTKRRQPFTKNKS